MNSINIGDITKRVNTVGIMYKNKEQSHNILTGKKKESHDSITVRKQRAQERAFKIVADCNENEASLDENVEQRKQNIKELEESSVATLKAIQGYKDKVKEISKKYGITEETTNQASYAVGKELSEYEQEILPYQEIIKKNTQEVCGNQNSINDERYTLISISLERLKYHDMVDAKKESETILTTAAKEAANSLIGEVKEQVQDNIEETREALEKQEEKVQEKQAQDKQVQENQDQNKQVQTKDVKQIDGIGNQEILKQMKKVIMDEILMEEDLKGIVMDKQL